MKVKLLISILIFVIIFSCKRKSTDDYEYYQPNASDSVKTEAVEAPVVEQVVVEEPVEEPDRGVDLESHNYFIVVATYVVEDFAISQKKELAAQGYKPGIFMLNEDGWYRLAIESYETYDQANIAMERLKEKGGLFGKARVVFKKSKQ
jgi:cell division protein FtsN